MIREDYLLSLIQQLGEFFRRSIGGQSSDSTAELDLHLEQLSGEVLGLPNALIMMTPPEELIELFEMSDRMVVEKCYVTAEIHRLKAEVEKDPQQKTRFQERAIFFFEAVAQNLSGEIAALAKQHLEELQANNGNTNPSES